MVWADGVSRSGTDPHAACGVLLGLVVFIRIPRSFDSMVKMEGQKFSGAPLTGANMSGSGYPEITV